MPADLERQLPRFAEALGRLAPAISVDEILSRGTVSVDVEPMEGSLWDRAARVNVASAGDAPTVQDRVGERLASIELAPISAEPRTGSRVAIMIVLAAAAATVFFVALAGIVRTSDEPSPAVVSPSTVPAPATTTVPAPLAQADPAVIEAQATERLEAFLAARIVGEDAEGYVEVEPDVELPLLYATTAGAPYERYEIDRLDAPQPPDGNMTFSVRLFADGDATVVQQQISWDRSRSGGWWMDANMTTENGQPVVLSYTSADGEVTVSAPTTWDTWLPGTFELDSWDVWLGRLGRYAVGSASGDRIELVDPFAYDTWCADNGGSPLLTAPANAAAIAEQLIADPNFETTAPVAARIGGVEAVSIDVTLAHGGEACGLGMVDIPGWIHTLGWDPELRLRLYLVDLPDGMSVETLAITVAAPEERFDDVVAETASIIESIEFHSS